MLAYACSRVCPEARQASSKTPKVYFIIVIYEIVLYSVKTFDVS
jgi:hypothetical protein